MILRGVTILPNPLRSIQVPQLFLKSPRLLYAIYLALAHLLDVIDCGYVAIFIDQDDSGIAGSTSNIQVI